MTEPAETAAVADVRTPGFWRVSDETYFGDIEHISNSMLSTFLKWRPMYFDKYVEPFAPKTGSAVDPEEVADELPEEEAKSALNMGTALHAMVFETERFGDLVAVAPKVDRRTKEGKALYAKFVEESQGKTVLTSAEWCDVNGMYAAITSNRSAVQLLTMPGGIRETPIRWLDSGTGLWCKGKPDLIVEPGILVDLKSVREEIGRAHV